MGGPGLRHADELFTQCQGFGQLPLEPGNTKPCLHEPATQRIVHFMRRGRVTSRKVPPRSVSEGKLFLRQREFAHTQVNIGNMKVSLWQVSLGSALVRSILHERQRLLRLAQRSIQLVDAVVGERQALPQLGLDEGLILEATGSLTCALVKHLPHGYGTARAHSLNIVLDLKSEDWGQRHFCMQDPNGVYLDIVQALEPTEEYRGDYVPE